VTLFGYQFQGQKVNGQGHQAALLTAAFTHQAAAAVSVGKYSPREPTATLPYAGAAVGSAARGASAPTERGERRGHIVAAARLQFVLYDNNKTCLMFDDLDGRTSKRVTRVCQHQLGFKKNQVSLSNHRGFCCSERRRKCREKTGLF